ncbi:MAG: 2,3-diaminopropionate biosynthesis protein SbnB [Symploca sp. SIO2C1]|nr:2,3-diaminopropionate biosynthesis protein SbnB [Symploca sp. SIO2C1]
MTQDNVLILTGNEIYSILENQEQKIIETIGLAYQAHARGNTFMPPNAYLRFPGMDRERIIAKPAYLGEEFDLAGIKWIASFPGNLEKNLERASATLILNSLDTGHPTAIMESSIISAKRTAASAALAARCLYLQEPVLSVGLIGCGVINFETVKFLKSVYREIEKVWIFDLNPERALQFKTQCLKFSSSWEILIQDSLTDVVKKSPILSIATNAITPFIKVIDNHPENALILHISLRDLSPEIILNSNNVVDDVEQVCSNQTSLHLAEQQVGNRNFISFTIGDLLNEEKIYPPLSDKPLSIFSPFGLGILDIAIAKLVQQLAGEQNYGISLPSFLPKSWIER